MQRPLTVIAVSVVLAAAVSLLVTVGLNRSADPPAAGPAIFAQAPKIATVDFATVEDLHNLRLSLDGLAMEVAELRQLAASFRREAATPAVAATERETESQPSLRKTAMKERVDDSILLRTKVEEALLEIEEEKEAARWVEELEERREEAVKANEEYDTFDKELETRLGKLQDELFLDRSQLKSLRSLLSVQNDRNREMTRLWSEGDTLQDELGRIFGENRKAHRSEVMALLGEDQLGSYRELIARGNLGPRFAFFVGPKEEWGEDKEK